MNDPLSAVVARVTELDTEIRAIDPGWTGLSFDAALDTATASGASAGSTVVPVGLAGAAAASYPYRGVSPAGYQGPPAALAMVEPVPGARVTQGFGPTDVAEEPPATVDGVSYRHYHNGIDLAAPYGSPVHAAADGVVELAGQVPDGAVDVKVRHADGSETLYGHLQADLAVRVGQRVTAGDVVGSVGVTGNTTGPHVHFALYENGRSIDPAPWLSAGRLPGGAVGIPGSTAQGDASIGSLERFDRVAEQIPYAGAIRSAAVAAGVDPLLLASLIRAESGFRPSAVSFAGAMGMTQLMPATARALDVRDPFDAAANIAGGARYLASDLRIYGRVDVALAAYQAGKGSVARAGGIPDSPTTHGYIDRILGYWSDYLSRASAGAGTPGSFVTDAAGASVGAGA